MESQTVASFAVFFGRKVDAARGFTIKTGSRSGNSFRKSQMKIQKTALSLLSIALTGLLAENLAAQSFVAIYDFGQVTTSSGLTDPTAPPTATGVTFGSFTSTGASANPNASARFSFTSQPTGATTGVDDFSQFTGSLSLTAYFEVTITPLNLVQLQLDNIAFTVQRSGTGIRSYAVRSSVDGFAANLAASINPANANLGVGPGDEFRVLLDSVTTLQNGSLVTLGPSHASLTSPVTFRFYGWNAEASTGTFSVDNVQFSGSAQGSVPEPTTSALIILGFGAWSIRRRLNR